MSKAFPMVPLGEVLIESEERADIDPGAYYRQVTVRLWGKGVALRGEIAGSDIAASKQFLVRTNQFILSKIDARNGAFGLIPASLDSALVSSDFPVFTLNKSRIIPEFLHWMSKTRNFIGLCKAASEGTTNRVRLKIGRFLATKIPLPPLEEQQRIVARIEELAGKIEEARGLRRETVEEANNFLVACRVRVFEKASQLGVSKLNDLAILERGKFSHRPRNDPRFFGGNHPWIQIAEIESSGKYIKEWHQTLNDDGLNISKKFPKGTLLISIAATIGSAGILTFDCCIPDSIVAVIPRPGIDSEYLYHYFAYLRTHLEKLAPQSTQKNINLEILSVLPIPLLKLSEQQRIVAYLDDLQSKVDTLKRKQAEAAELDALLPSILDKAFKGEL
jgi:type I restriction enzyme S subunit